MKKWYEELDEATKQRIKTYSAFNDWESKDLMLQTLHEAEQKEIEEFKETNHELAELAIARNKRIAELEKENAELKKKIGIYQKGMYDEIEKRDKKLTKATEIIKSLIALHYNPVVTKDDLKKQDKILEQAEQFLKEAAE